MPEVGRTVPSQNGETFPAQGTTERISIPILVDEYVKSGDDLLLMMRKARAILVWNEMPGDLLLLY